MSLSFNFGNVFASISLNASNIELEEEDSDTDESENFNVNIQTYLVFEGEYKEFTVIRVNLNIIKNDGEKHLYDKDDPYLKPNNAGYNDIIWMNYIYDYCVFHLRSKAINNFFLRVMFKPMKKIYKEEETRYWILTIKTTIYGTFILLFKHLSMYMKEGIILKRC